MKTKTKLTTFLAIIALAMMAFSQNVAASGFSQFSMPQNMGTNINSADMEQGPAPAPNGLSLYFTSNRTAGGQGGNDIWVLQRATLSSAWGAGAKSRHDSQHKQQRYHFKHFVRRARDVYYQQSGRQP